jgi:hypothetical protein
LTEEELRHLLAPDWPGTFFAKRYPARLKELSPAAPEETPFDAPRVGGIGGANGTRAVKTTRGGF